MEFEEESGQEQKASCVCLPLPLLPLPSRFIKPLIFLGSVWLMVKSKMSRDELASQRLYKLLIVVDWFKTRLPLLAYVR